MSVRAIVFDFDGVLADSESLHLRSYQDILSPHGITLTQDGLLRALSRIRRRRGVPADCGGLRPAVRRRGNRDPDAGKDPSLSGARLER